MRAAILLAAGTSRRFGQRDKLKERLAGRRLIDHAIANARASGVQRVLLVTSRPVQAQGVIPVRARDLRSGMAVSLAAGLAALRPIEREVLIFLADMPFACAPRLRLQPGMDAVRPVFGGQPGHPILVRTSVAKERVGRGDTGLGRMLRTALVRGARDHVLDVDTPHALRLARRQGSYSGRRRSQWR